MATATLSTNGTKSAIGQAPRSANVANDTLHQAAVYETTDLSKFKLIHNNRDVPDSAIKKMRKSLEHNNRLEYNPILVDDQMRVLDGQTRLLAARQLGCSMYYQFASPGMTLIEIIHENSTVKRWSLKDALNFYANEPDFHNREHYQWLQNFLQKYKSGGFSLNITAMLRDIARTGYNSTDFRYGRFQITPLQREHAEEFVRVLEEVVGKMKEVDLDSFRYINFTRAFYRFYNHGVQKRDINKPEPRGYDHTWMLDRIQNHGRTKFGKATTIDEYLYLLENLYNFNKSDGQSLVVNL